MDEQTVPTPPAQGADEPGTRCLTCLHEAHSEPCIHSALDTQYGECGCTNLAPAVPQGAAAEPTRCPNPHCDEGLIRGTALGCAVCMRPVSRERLERAGVVFAAPATDTAPDDDAVFWRDLARSCAREIAALRQSLASAEALIEKYAWHDPACRKKQDERDCTCGFDDAIAALSPSPSKPAR